MANLTPTAYTEQFSIDISHVASGNKVSFGAFLSSFSDSYKTNIKSQTVYGRMDPVVNYQNTTRTITLAFVVPSSSIENAAEHLRRISLLIKFQYPSYSDAKVTSGIATPPICRLKFENLATEGGSALYGYFTGVDFSPVNESGYFVSDDKHIYPKEFKINLNFTVLHTKVLGWTKNRFAQAAYPYPVVNITEQTAQADLGNLNNEDLEPTDEIEKSNADSVLV